MIDLESARLIFGKWLDEKSSLLCRFSLFACELNVTGHIVELSERQVVFKSREGDAAFALRVDLEDTSFWYATPREWARDGEVPIEDEDKDLSGIGIALPLRITPQEVRGPLRIPVRDKVIFLEISSRRKDGDT